LCTVAEAMANPVVTKYIEKDIKKMTGKCMIHTMPSYFESVSSNDQFIRNLDQSDGFSIPGEELTITIKSKRRIITGEYKDLIVKVYMKSLLYNFQITIMILIIKYIYIEMKQRF